MRIVWLIGQGLGCRVNIWCAIIATLNTQGLESAVATDHDTFWSCVYNNGYENVACVPTTNGVVLKSTCWQQFVGSAVALLMLDIMYSSSLYLYNVDPSDRFIKWEALFWTICCSWQWWWPHVMLDNFLLDHLSTNSAYMHYEGLLVFHEHDLILGTIL